MSKLDGKIIKAVRVSNTDLGRIVGKSLKTLRELAGLTQQEVAARLKMGRAKISEIERRADVQISSLQKYVEALGATLRIDAAFTRDALQALKIQTAFDPELHDDDQLVFPIFGDDLFRPKRDVVLSVRPIYSRQLIEGKKTIELRRRFPISAPRGTIAYIYSTSPVQAMIGSAQISDVLKLPITEIWKKFGKLAQIDKPDFNAYFSGLDEGFALKIRNPRAFTRPIDLAELRTRFGF